MLDEGLKVNPFNLLKIPLAQCSIKGKEGQDWVLVKFEIIGL